MGEVWRGLTTRGTAVAVKVLTGAAAGGAAFARAFRDEVRAVARLDHPHVVQVFDHGVVDAAAADASKGRLTAGSPFLAMEWVSGGTLASAGPTSFRELRRLLDELLGAVAHAHARGVVHRDLKPGNVLRAGPGDARPGIKLADFGIARLPDAEGTTGMVAGTFSYMAPEQVSGMWRDEGAWTDLYALGCVAYRLVTGTPPFVRNTPAALAEAHLLEPPPPLRPRFPVPDDFEGWLAALLEKSPRRRFRRAADAAWALDQLPDPAVPTHPPAASSVAPPREDATSTKSSWWPAPPRRPDPTKPTLVLETAPPSSVPSSVPPPSVAPERRAPPMPATWRSDHDAMPTRIAPAGLGLYGLRPIPMVDRESERDRLWALLAEVRARNVASAVLLEGPAGAGKSRLAEWLAERAHEVGAATPLVVAHGLGASARDGVAAALARHLGCAGLGRDEIRDRVEDWLGSGSDDQEEVGAIVELLQPGGGRGLSDDESPIRLASAAERHETARRVLHRVARTRPVVLWIDDAQWGADAVALVLHLLDAQDRAPSPILAVVVARDDLAAEGDALGDPRAALARREDVARIEVGPLAADDRGALVRGLLGLSGDVAAQVETRTAGNPLFAVQLVGDWVQRGILEATDAGFSLRAGAHVDLPADLLDVWSGRVERLFAGRPPEAAASLELAALLGPAVDSTEWEAACAEASLLPAGDLLEALLDARFARRERGADGGWSFVHQMLRETLERRAKDSGRAPALHRACAAALARRRDERGVAERLGRHLLASGDAAAALAPLLEGARQRLDAGESRLASLLLADREAALGALAIGDDDERRAEGWALRARVTLHEGAVVDAERWAWRAEVAAARHGWSATGAAARMVLAKAALRRGDLDDAELQGRAARDLCERRDDARGVAEAESWLGVFALRRGDADGARTHQERALAIYDELGDDAGRATATNQLGLSQQARGDLAAAAELARRALTLHRRLGNRSGVAIAELSLGELARERGDFDAALVHDRRALATFEAIGAGQALVARLNLALAQLGARRFDDARTTLEELRHRAGRAGWRTLQRPVALGLVACAAAARQWPRWDRHWQAVIDAGAERGAIDTDVAWVAGLAGELAAAAGERDRARAAYELALGEWRAAGRSGEVAAVGSALERLGDGG